MPQFNTVAERDAYYANKLKTAGVAPAINPEPSSTTPSSTMKASAASTTSALPTLNTTSTPTKTTTSTSTPESSALNATPEATAATKAARQAAYNAAGQTQSAPETNPEASPWINTRTTPTSATTVANETTQPTGVSLTGAGATSEGKAAADASQQTDWEAEASELGDKQISAEQEYRDFTIAQAKEKYNLEQANLDRLEKLQQEALLARNQAINQGADVQRRDAEIAYKASKSEYDLQRERTKQAYEQQIVEQKANNLQKTLNKESQIAAMGGYGNLGKNKEMAATMIDNDKVLNNIVFQKDISDQEISLQIGTVTDKYFQNLRTIEVDKQTAISKTYSEYLGYIANIQGSKEMSAQEKDEAIAAAAMNYKKNVAGINQATFEARYNISETAKKEAEDMSDKIRSQAKDSLSTILNTWAVSNDDLTAAQQQSVMNLEKQAGLPVGITLAGLKNLKDKAKAENLQIEQETDSDGNVTYVAINKTTGQIEDYTTLKGIGKNTADQNKYDTSVQRVTNADGSESLMTVTTDKTTGKVVSQMAGDIKPITSGGQKANNDYSPSGTNLPVHKNSDGSVTVDIPTGAKGGQCGRFVNNYLGKAVMPDSYAGKMKNRNSTVPTAGAVFVMPYKSTGHTGIVEKVNLDKKPPTVTVADSNWGLDEKVQHHDIPISSITGYIATDVPMGEAAQTDSALKSSIDKYIAMGYSSKVAKTKAANDAAKAASTATETASSAWINEPYKATKWLNDKPQASIADQYFNATKKPLVAGSADYKNIQAMKNDPAKMKAYIDNLTSKKTSSSSDFADKLKSLNW